MTARRKIRRTALAGYTLIEVMMAVAVMTVGSLGVLGLHQATTRGNSNARTTATATELTREWLERMRRDGLKWTAPGMAGVAGTDNLKNVPAAALTAGDWFVPLPAMAATPVDDYSERIGADHDGMDTNVAADQRFCTHVRMRWVVVNQAIRVDVRTFWNREIPEADRTAFSCATAPAAITAELASATPRLSAVQGSTVIRWVEPPP